MVPSSDLFTDDSSPLNANSFSKKCFSLVRVVQTHPSATYLYFLFMDKYFISNRLKKLLEKKKVFRKVENFMSGCKSKKDIFKMQFQSRVSAKKAAETF
jgi:hypothetical protein